MRQPARNIFILAAYGLLILFLAACSDSSEQSSHVPEEGTDEPSWRRFEGAWFSIKAPANFAVRPSLMNGDSGEYDSVFFIAPGNDASFYVLSPQWRRKPHDIALQTDKEIELERTEGIEAGLIKTTYLIQARDKAYQRLVESYTAEDQTANWQFQFYYTNEKTRKTYASTYARFKLSLQQYAD